MIRDKVKPIKSVDDSTHIIEPGESDLRQCPYCKHLHNIRSEHICTANRFDCTLCGLDIEKKQKKVRGIRNQWYYTFGYKKYFKHAGSIICWNCAFNITKQFKESTSNA